MNPIDAMNSGAMSDTPMLRGTPGQGDSPPMAERDAPPMSDAPAMSGGLARRYALRRLFGGARASLAAMAMILIGLAAAGAPQAQAQNLEEWGLDAGNTEPSGIWATETRVYVLDFSDSYIQAYNRKTGATVSGDSGGLVGLSASASLQGLWSNGTIIWVADAHANKLFAYNLATLNRETGSEFNLHAMNGEPRGLWSGTVGGVDTMYVVDDDTTNRLFVYNRGTGAHIRNCTLADTTNPVGLHGRTVTTTSSTVTTLYVADSSVNTIRAFTPNCTRQSANDITLSAAGVGAAPGGLGGSATGEREALMVIADDTNNRVRVWHLGTNTRFATPFIRLASGGNDKVTEGQVARLAVRFKATDADDGPDYIPLSDYPPTIGEWRAILDHAVPSNAITEARPAPGTSCPTDLETTGDFVDPGGAGNSLVTNEAVTYTPTAGTPSATGTFMHVTTCDDRLHEGGGTNFTNESLARGFGKPENARLGSNFASGLTQLVRDNDLGVSLSVPSSATEGGAAQITVNLTAMPGDVGGNLVFPVTIDQAAGINFLASSDIGTRSVTVTAATNTASFTINLPEDNLDEDSGSLQFGFGDFTADVDLLDYGIWTDPTPASPNFGEPTGDQFVTAQDNDPEPFVSVANVTVDESEDFMVFTLSLQDSTGTAIASGRNVSLTFTTEGGGTATAGEDYVANTSLAVTVTAGFISQMFSVDIDDDSTGERAETVILAPTGNPVNGQFHSGVTNLNFRPVGTINDDDLPFMEFDLHGGDGVTGISVTEGGAPVFRLSVVEAHTADIPVTVMIEEVGNALADASTRTVTLPASQKEVFFTLATVDDNTDEETAKVKVTPSSDNFVGADATHVLGREFIDIEIVDDEDPPVFTVQGATAPEGVPAVFRVAMRPASGAINGNVSDYAVTVDYEAAMGSGMATAGEDFEAVSGTLTFRPSDTEAGNEQEVTVPLLMDADNIAESFTFTLSMPMNAAFAGGGAELAVPGMIQELPILSIMADDPNGTGAVAENEAAVFTITMSRPLAAPSIVPVTVSQTAGNMLAAEQQPSVTFPAGELTGGMQAVKYTVAIEDDARDEIDGMIRVTIAAPTGREDEYIVMDAAASAELTVLDNDDAPMASVLPPPAGERIIEGDVMPFAVELSGPSEREITLAYAAEGGTAMPGEDYERTAGTLTFAANETQHVLQVQTLEDAVTDPDETIVMRISDPVNATLGTASAMGTLEEGLTNAEIAALNEAILPHVLAAVSEETSGAIQDRVQTAFDGSGAARGLSIRGASATQFLEGLLPGEVHALRHSRESGNLESLAAALDSRLRGNDGGWDIPAFNASDFNFTAPLSATEGAALPPITVWGRGYYRDLSVEGDAPITFDGEIAGALLGLEERFSQSFLAGFAFSHSQAEVEWDNIKLTGAHETTLSGIHPYFGWQLSSGLRFWGSFGYGQGEVEITEDTSDAFRYERDVAMSTFAAGGYGPLPSVGPVDFGIIADAAYAQLQEQGSHEVEAASVATGWLRAGVEADYTQAIPDGSTFEAALELALRSDFGDAKSGGGIELGSQLEYRHPIGFRADLKGRALLAHEDDDVEEWGISGGIAYSTSAPGGQGFAIAFSPEWGILASQRDQLWNGGFAVNHAVLASPTALREESDAALRYNLEVQYGLPVMQGRDLLTFFARSDLRSDARNYALGADLKLGAHITAGYESTLNRRAPLNLLPAAVDAAAPQEAIDHRAYLRFEKRF